MKKLLVVLLMSWHPQIAAADVDPTIRNGNFAFTKPYLMPVSHAKSEEEKAVFALAITAKEQDRDKNGLITGGRLNFYATLRSSDVVNIFEHDYKFLQYLCGECAKAIKLKDYEIPEETTLSVTIHSAHIV